MSDTRTPAPTAVEALRQALTVMTAETIGTYRMDDPDWYCALNKAVASARAALAAPQSAPGPAPDAMDSSVEKAWHRFCLENCRLFAARHRKEEWAKTILRFCEEAGVKGSPLRAPTAEPARDG
jgi:hypothetical protein